MLSIRRGYFGGDDESAQLSSQCTLQRRIIKALRARLFVVETAVSAMEYLQLARATEYEAILVDAVPIRFGGVLPLVKVLREINSGASLFVFARYFDLEQLLGFFEAGADDCVAHSLLPSWYCDSAFRFDCIRRRLVWNRPVL
jgi:ActR/RegA family two-component response regulator